jgi:hypothetical protein
LNLSDASYEDYRGMFPKEDEVSEWVRLMA